LRLTVHPGFQAAKNLPAAIAFDTRKRDMGVKRSIFRCEPAPRGCSIHPLLQRQKFGRDDHPGKEDSCSIKETEPFER
jgi:hypothetical protein